MQMKLSTAGIGLQVPIIETRGSAILSAQLYLRNNPSDKNIKGIHIGDLLAFGVQSDTTGVSAISTDWFWLSATEIKLVGNLHSLIGKR